MYLHFDFIFKIPASTVSFIVYIINSPKGEFLHMLIGVLLAALVSFIIAAIILKFTKEPDQDIEAATEKMEASKGKKSSVYSKLIYNKDSNTSEATSASITYIDT